MLAPLMQSCEIDFFKSYLNENKTVFEWGTGGSTVEFSKLVKKYYSVEHDFEWYRAVLGELPKNAKLYYVPPNTKNLEWNPKFEEGSRKDFKNYAEFINYVGILNGKFDIIFIDGRARVDCAFEALAHLKEGSIVFLHDIERVYYWDVLKNYEILEITGKLAAMKKKREFLNNDRILLAEKFLRPYNLFQPSQV